MEKDTPLELISIKNHLKGSFIQVSLLIDITNGTDKCRGKTNFERKGKQMWKEDSINNFTKNNFITPKYFTYDMTKDVF